MTTKLQALSAAASPGPCHATRDRSADPGQRVWTLSGHPDRTGWETDSGFDGYGLRKADAELHAELWNAWREGRLQEVPAPAG